MSRIWLLLATFIAVSAFAGSAFASEPETVGGDLKVCLRKCADQGALCSGGTALPKACTSIKECDLSKSVKEGLNTLCRKCSKGERECVDKTTQIIVHAKPAGEKIEGTIVKARSSKKLTLEKMCQLSDGVMLEVFVGLDPKKQELVTQQECRNVASIVKAVDKMTPLTADVPDANSPIFKHFDKEDGDEAESKKPEVKADEKKPEPKVDEKPAEEKKPVIDEKALDAAHDEVEAAVENEYENVLPQPKPVAEERSESLPDNRAAATTTESPKYNSLGLELVGMGLYHTIRPYGQDLYGAGVKASLIPKLSDDVSLPIGIGVGYSGDKAGSRLTMLVVTGGVQIKVHDGETVDVHLPIGFMTQQIVNQDGEAPFASYMGYAGPKLYIGEGSSKFSVGAEVGVGATEFQHKDGTSYTEADASFGLFLGYAYMP